jgi:hypothetical protein
MGIHVAPSYACLLLVLLPAGAYQDVSLVTKRL